MKNIQEIKGKLAKPQDNNKIHQMVNSLPEIVLLDSELKKILSNSSIVFIKKLIKHLDSKSPGKSSITNVINLSFYKLKRDGINEEGLKGFLARVVEVINSTFEGAFSNRLTVKSKEFLDLEDCEPF